MVGSVVVAIENEEGKFLFGKSTDPDSRNGKWVFPGGKLEGNETIEQGALREAKEETGLDTAFIRLIPSVDSNIVFVHLRLIGGGLTPNHEFEQLLWLTRDEYASLAPDIFYGNLAVVRSMDVYNKDKPMDFSTTQNQMLKPIKFEAPRAAAWRNVWNSADEVNRARWLTDAGFGERARPFMVHLDWDALNPEAQESIITSKGGPNFSVTQNQMLKPGGSIGAKFFSIDTLERIAEQIFAEVDAVGGDTSPDAILNDLKGRYPFENSAELQKAVENMFNKHGFKASAKYNFGPGEKQVPQSDKEKAADVIKRVKALNVDAARMRELALEIGNELGLPEDLIKAAFIESFKASAKFQSRFQWWQVFDKNTGKLLEDQTQSEDGSEEGALRGALDLLGPGNYEVKPVRASQYKASAKFDAHQSQWDSADEATRKQWLLDAGIEEQVHSLVITQSWDELSSDVQVDLIAEAGQEGYSVISSSWGKQKYEAKIATMKAKGFDTIRATENAIRPWDQVDNDVKLALGAKFGLVSAGLATTKQGKPDKFGFEPRSRSAVARAFTEMPGFDQNVSGIMDEFGGLVDSMLIKGAKIEDIVNEVVRQINEREGKLGAKFLGLGETGLVIKTVNQAFLNDPAAQDSAIFEKVSQQLVGKGIRLTPQEVEQVWNRTPGSFNAYQVSIQQNEGTKDYAFPSAEKAVAFAARLGLINDQKRAIRRMGAHGNYSRAGMTITKFEGGDTAQEFPVGQKVIDNIGGQSGTVIGHTDNKVKVQWDNGVQTVNTVFNLTKKE